MDTKIFKEGHLSKEGKSIKTKKRRLYILKVDGLYSYKKSKKDNENESTKIEFYESTQVAVDIVRNGKKKGVYCFSISNPDKSFALFADSEQEMDAWVTAIEEALNEFKKAPDSFRQRQPPSVEVTPDVAKKKSKLGMMQRFTLTFGGGKTTARATPRQYNSEPNTSRYDRAVTKIGVLGATQVHVDQLIESAHKKFKKLRDAQNAAENTQDTTDDVTSNTSTTVHVDSPLSSSLIGNLPATFSDMSYISDISSLSRLSASVGGSNTQPSPRDMRLLKQNNRNKTINLNLQIDLSSVLIDSNHVSYTFGEHTLELEIVDVSQGGTTSINTTMEKCDGFIIVYDAFDRAEFSHSLILQSLARAVRRVPVVFAGNITKNFNPDNRRKQSLLFSKQLNASMTPRNQEGGNSSSSSANNSPDSRDNDAADDYTSIKQQIQALGRDALQCDISTPLELNIINPFHMLLEDINGVTVSITSEMDGKDVRKLFPEEERTAISRVLSAKNLLTGRRTSNSSSNKRNKRGFIIENADMLGFDDDDHTDTVFNMDTMLARNVSLSLPRKTRKQALQELRRKIYPRLEEEIEGDSNNRKTKPVMCGGSGSSFSKKPEITITGH